MEWAAIAIIVIWCIYAEWRITQHIRLIEALLDISKQQAVINRLNREALP